MKFCITRKTTKYCDFFTKVVLLFFLISIVTHISSTTVHGFNTITQEYSITDEKISVDFSNLRLDEAIIKISKKTGKSINYSADLFDSSKRISFSATEIPISDLLEAILPDGITYDEYSSDIILLKEETKIAESQEKAVRENVRGMVVDASTGDPLPGVNILIKGTDRGTSTNPDGEFELSVSDLNRTLIVTYIGYVRTEIPIEDKPEWKFD